MTQTLAEQFKNARRYGVPLIGIETPDPQATIENCMQALTNGTVSPVFIWDSVGGMRWNNPQGEAVAAKIFQTTPVSRQQLSDATINPTECLMFAAKLENGSVLFMMNAQQHLDQATTAQAVWLLRDKYKNSRRTLVLLGPTLTMPAELSHDVLLFDEPLPSDELIGVIADKLYDMIGSTTKFPKLMRENTVRAARGLSAFGAEQAIALSLSKSGIDAEILWTHKKHFIEATKGLRIYQGTETFADIGGLEQLKEFGRLLFAGREKPAAVVWIDEIEKAMAGSSGPVGDSSGTTQDQLSTILQEMQNNEWPGMILPGPPGCAKSMFAKALGTTHEVPCIQLDLGAMKGSLVGASEAAIRSAFKVIKAVAGKNAFFVATCNRMESLPPELRRRFTDGVFFCDLPDEDEREMIWAINRKRYKIHEDDKQPADLMFTGADIRNVCAIAYRLKVSLKKAATFITPVAVSDPAAVEKLRALANGRFLSASYPGVYCREKEEDGISGRTVNV